MSNKKTIPGIPPVLEILIDIRKLLQAAVDHLGIPTDSDPEPGPTSHGSTFGSRPRPRNHLAHPNRLASTDTRRAASALAPVGSKASVSKKRRYRGRKGTASSKILAFATRRGIVDAAAVGKEFPWIPAKTRCAALTNLSRTGKLTKIPKGRYFEYRTKK